jgi:hypothetical protein
MTGGAEQGAKALWKTGADIRERDERQRDKKVEDNLKRA